MPSAITKTHGKAGKFAECPVLPSAMAIALGKGREALPSVTRKALGKASLPLPSVTSKTLGKASLPLPSVTLGKEGGLCRGPPVRRSAK